MKKIFLIGLMLAFSVPSVWAQSRGLVVLEKLAKASVRKSSPAARRAARVQPLSNARIEALVRRGKEKLVIKRALAVAAERNYPIFYILHNGEVNDALLAKAWKGSRRTMARWDAQNTLGLNAWLMVFANKVQHALCKTDPKILKLLRTELKTAQTQAEEMFRSQHAYLLRTPLTVQQMEPMPEYRALLAESVAQRLTDKILPKLNSQDRVKFLKILMQGVFDSSVKPVDLNMAILEKDVHAGLRFLGPRITQVQGYGVIKSHLNACARRAAEIAANNNIRTLEEIRALMLKEMECFDTHWVPGLALQTDWQKLIHFYKDNADALKTYPRDIFLQ